MVMRDRPSDVGLRPFGDEGTQPLPAPPPSDAPIMAAALGTLRDAAKTRVFWILFATFFICGASTNGLVQVHLIPMCLDFGIPQVEAASSARRHGRVRFRRHHHVRAGCPTSHDNRIICCSGITACGAWSLVLLPFTNFSFYGLSLFAMFYAG